MALLTLATARQSLWNYASGEVFATATPAQMRDVDTLINRVSSRFLMSGKWRGSVVRAQFTVYDNQITLPRSMETVLGCRPVSSTAEEDDQCACGTRMSVYNQWYQFASGGASPEDCCNPGLLDLGEGFATFRDITFDFKVKAIPRLTEQGNATLLLRGLDADDDHVFSGTSTEGVSLAINSAANVTTTQVFSSLDSWVKSGPTNGIVDLWAIPNVAADGSNTLFASIFPGELTSGYRRYAIPRSTTANTDIVEVIAKRAYFAAVADNDPVIPGNIEALACGIQALILRNANSLKEARELMAEAFSILDEDRQEFDGDNAVGPVNFVGSFGAGEVLNVM